MQMRLLTVAIGLWLLSEGAFAVEPCSCANSAPYVLTARSADSTRPQFEPETKDLLGNYSSLRGLSLDMSEKEAERALQRLGFTMASPHSPSDAVDICRGQTMVGVIRFSKKRTIDKIELNPLYFSVGRTDLREFADSVFRRFNVRKADVRDDVCYWDVTCFRGTTLAEKFLIVRIAEDVQLHVGKKPPGSDFTQR